MYVLYQLGIILYSDIRWMSPPHLHLHPSHPVNPSGYSLCI